MAQFFGSLHIPVDVERSDAKLMLQSPTAPQGRRLLIFRYSDFLAFQILRLFDSPVGADQDARMEEASRGKNRNGDESLIAMGQSHQQRRARHFRNVEFAEVQLTPEHF